MEEIYGFPSIFISYCGYEKCCSAHSFGPAVRSQFLLHFVMSGCGVYKVGGREYKVGSGEVFLIKPRESTFYRADDRTPWEYAWVAFDGSDSPEIIKKTGLLDRYVKAVRNKEAFQENILKLIAAYTDQSDNEYKILSYFYSMMAELFAYAGKRSGGGYEEEYLNKAVSYIKSNFSYRIKVEDIASFVGIDRTYLYKIFLKNKNISPKEYINQIRLNTAKNMLMEQYTAGETALSCGFHDSAAFCNAFKKQTGFTPRQFSAEVRANHAGPPH